MPEQLPYLAEEIRFVADGFAGSTSAVSLSPDHAAYVMQCCAEHGVQPRMRQIGGTWMIMAEDLCDFVNALYGRDVVQAPAVAPNQSELLEELAKAPRMSAREASPSLAPELDPEDKTAGAVPSRRASRPMTMDQDIAPTLPLARPGPDDAPLVGESRFPEGRTRPLHDDHPVPGEEEEDELPSEEALAKMTPEEREAFTKKRSKKPTAKRH